MNRDFTTKPRPDQPGRCPSIDPHDTLQCTRAIHDDDQCQAGGIAWRKGSPRIEWDRERADRLQKDVERMQKDIERLTAERDAAIERLERVIDQWRKTGRAVISEMNRADNAEAERDALAAAHARESKKVWNVEEVMDDIEGSDPTTWERLRDALAGSDADTTDTQSTDPGCGCSTNPARARYADGDPAGCYCTCSDDAREGCEHEPDEPQPTDLEVK